MRSTAGHREQKKHQTRQAIVEAALELFETQGFDATTIDGIADTAGIAPRTFLNYFASKEDVVVEDYATRLERVVEMLGRSHPDEPVWPALRNAFLAVGADYESQRAQLLRRFRIMSETPSVTARSLELQARWEREVAVWVADRLGVDVTRDLTSNLVAGTALSAMRASMQVWLAHRARTPLPRHIEECFSIAGAGLGSIDR